MDLVSRIGDFLSDDRLLFNLIALHALLGLILLVSILLRRALVHGGDNIARLTGLRWLRGASQEAARKLGSFLFLATLGVMGIAVVTFILYHLAGRDVRSDIVHWYEQLTWQEIVQLLVSVGELAALLCGAWLAGRYCCRLLPWLHDCVGQALGEKEKSLSRWSVMLERYAMILLSLAVVWCAGHIVGLGKMADKVVGSVFPVVVIVSLAHLLILSCRTLSQALAAWGSRSLGTGKLQRYWERVTRLFPFGERCFEAAVFVAAASLCIRRFTFIAVVAGFGPRIVECIGIFFGTRVLIELLQVLLNEAFGVYEEGAAMDQKRLTLVPLLQSLSQYVLYFGSGVMMLDVLGVPTSPILAGAGILGLAGGLGAQSLVTDVVSGFFILFENQYLVGDYVRINDAAGRVEAVSIRTTQIRDEQGRLHTIPNGQIKRVINYSKTYVIAQVDLKLPADRNVDDVFQAMTEAGRRLRQMHKEVLADTVIKGIVDLTPDDMTVRAVTKVHPGTHHAMQNEYRRLLKEVFDEHKTGAAVAPNPPALAA